MNSQEKNELKEGGKPKDLVVVEHKALKVVKPVGGQKTVNGAHVERGIEASEVLNVDEVENQKARAVLKSIATGDSITQACYEAGISGGMHYHWVNTSRSYAAAYEQAQACAVEVWESEVKRRAFEGVEEPVFQHGREVGRVRKYSDLLTMFFLKGARPEKYRDNYTAVNVQVNIASDVESARKRIKQQHP